MISAVFAVCAVIIVSPGDAHSPTKAEQVCRPAAAPHYRAYHSQKSRRHRLGHHFRRNGGYVADYYGPSAPLRVRHRAG